MPERLLNIQDLADRLKISPKTIRNKLSNGTWPITPIRIGRALRWRETDVAAAIAGLSGGKANNGVRHDRWTLRKARRMGGGWIARRPAHDDQTPSLSIRDADDGKVLVRCHAGCDQEQVIATLRSLDLWTENGFRRLAAAT